MALQHYNSNDLATRTAVAACAIACKAVILAKKLRQGSTEYCDMKAFEVAVHQFNCIRCGFSVLELPASTKITVTADGGTNVDTTITINGVTVSNAFRYDTDNTTTAQAIADAINNYTSSPDYTATVLNNVVTVTAVTKGGAINQAAVALVGGDVTASAEFMNGGQDGVDAADNILTEEQVEHMFNNIAEFTGCCYAPLGYGYESTPTPKLGVPLALNAGGYVLLNTGNPVRLNKPLI